MITKIEWHYDGFNELRNSSEVASYVEEVAESIVPGDGYEVTSQKGKTRAQIRIEAVTEEAVQDNLRENTLIKAIS